MRFVNSHKGFRALCLATSLLSISACGSASDLAENSSESTTAFPSNLTVASPLDTDESDASGNLTRALTSGSPAFTAKASFFKASLEEILAASSSSSCTFDASLFLEQEEDANCYGPTIDYQNHIDATTGPDDGQLPPGDLGMWSDEEADGQACAAAEFNARMNGIQYRSHAALMSIASMICAMNTSGGTLPVNATLDLTSAMTSLALPDLVFSTASITHNSTSGEDEYDYALEFSYAPAGTPQNIVVEMEHHPGDSDTAYQGRLSYLVNTEFNDGNCDTDEATSNNSLVYDGDGEDVNMEVRSAYFCGHDVDGRVDGIVNPDDRYNAASNPDGWGNNFSIFTASSDPLELDGSYVYAWQAGPDDDNSRIFNLVLETSDDDDSDESEDDSDNDSDDEVETDLSKLTGEAFFGYGDAIQTTDGSITGFICNWAGPGANHTGIENAQYQSLDFDAVDGQFSATASNIEYAPTNSCGYNGSATFVYDTDDDGSLSDESSTTVITSDLLSGVDSNLDGTATIEERIGQSGFDLPETPVNP